MSKIKRMIPNTITTIRLIIAIIFPFLYFSGDILTSVIVFAIAASSDFVDGYLARKWHVESKYGRVVDPIADKMLLGFALLFMVFSNPIILMPLFGEILIVLLGIFYYLKYNKPIKVAFIGKVKTIPLAMTVGFGLLTMIHHNLIYILFIFACLTFFMQILVALSYSKHLSNMLKDIKNKYFKKFGRKNNLFSKIKELKRKLERIVKDKEKGERVAIVRRSRKDEKNQS